MHSSETTAGGGLQATELNVDRFADVLSSDARAFLEELHRRFEPSRRTLLPRRAERQAAFGRGELPGFPVETAGVREGDWRVPPAPADLTDRRVEITGPVDRKMMINALNSGANVFMADFEDANSPTWHNNIDGQINLRDALRRTIAFESPE